MRGPRNRRSRRTGVIYRPRPAVALLASAAIAIGVWWLGTARPTGEAIRAGVTLPELSLPSLALPQRTWGVLDPLRAQPFRLSSVDFAGLEVLTAANLLTALDLEPSIPLIDVDPEAVCSKLRAAEPRIASCDAARLFPSRLVIQLRERRAVAVVEPTGAGLDAGGAPFALGPEEGSELPRLTGEISTALAALLEAKRLEIAVQSVDAERTDDVRVELASGGTVLRLGADAPAGLQRWQALLRRVSMAELKGVEVDARFRGQVVLRDLEPVRGPDALALGGK